MNFTTVAATPEQCMTIVETLQSGYEYDRKHRPSPEVAMAILLEANLGIRVSDVVQLRLCDIIKDGKEYRLDIIEKKTGKARKFPVSNEDYQMLLDYALDQGYSKTDLLVPVSTVYIQRAIKNVCEFLGYERISTHSFRKLFAGTVYENSGYDVRMVQESLQHFSLTSTQRYLCVPPERMKSVLKSVNFRYYNKKQ